MNPKIGDKVLCIKTGYMEESGKLFATKGKQYEIVNIVYYNTIVLKTENDDYHQWYEPNHRKFREYFSLIVKPWGNSEIKHYFI